MRVSRWRVATVTLAAALSAAACRSADADREVSAALADVLANAPMSPALERAVGALLPTAVQTVVWTDVEAFYRQRGARPAWVSPVGPTERALAAIRVIQRASEHGFEPEDYGAGELIALYDWLAADVESANEPAAQSLAAFETRLTAAMLAVGRDVAFGRTNPQMVDRRWRARREAIDLRHRLIETVERDPGAWLEAVRPRHPDYAALERVLAGREVTADQAATIALNLERWRWMPDDLGRRYVLVNIPAYRLFVRERERSVLESRVIVGTRGLQTPVFSSTMTSVVFSPYWNIPETIAAGETLPAIVKNPAYLAKNNIDVLRRTATGVERVDPATVEWDRPSATKGLLFRQRPGAANALGHVKFLLPNPYTVYLHDTPADELFARPGRALSHGCVRVEEARALAEYVLVGDLEWDEARIVAAMWSGNERLVPLAAPLPVHIVYLTVSVDACGTLQVWSDVYGHDARQTRVTIAR